MRMIVLRDLDGRPFFLNPLLVESVGPREDAGCEVKCAFSGVDGCVYLALEKPEEVARLVADAVPDPKVLVNVEMPNELDYLIRKVDALLVDFRASRLARVRPAREGEEPRCGFCGHELSYHSARNGGACTFHISAEDLKESCACAAFQRPPTQRELAEYEARTDG